MASLDSLPADQRAVLQLVLQRGRSYDEIAAMLSIDRAAVRDRALAAFDALGPPTEVEPQRRALITDYLLGQLPAKVSDQVCGHLAENATERDWARMLATELSQLASEPLPEIPPRGRRSRLGGAILLVLGAAVATAVGIVLATGGASSKRSTTPTGRSSNSAGTATGASSLATSTVPTHIVAQINLDPPRGPSRAKGFADVVAQGSRNAVAIEAQGLAANSTHPPNAYAVWLYNSPAASDRLGFVSPGVTSSGILRTLGALPADAAHYKRLIITLETVADPRVPGQIVLEGTLEGL